MGLRTTGLGIYESHTVMYLHVYLDPACVDFEVERAGSRGLSNQVRVSDARAIHREESEITLNKSGTAKQMIDEGDAGPDPWLVEGNCGPIIAAHFLGRRAKKRVGMDSQVQLIEIKRSATLRGIPAAPEIKDLTPISRIPFSFHWRQPGALGIARRRLSSMV